MTQFNYRSAVEPCGWANTAHASMLCVEDTVQHGPLINPPHSVDNNTDINYKKISNSNYIGLACTCETVLRMIITSGQL